MEVTQQTPADDSLLKPVSVGLPPKVEEDIRSQIQSYLVREKAVAKLKKSGIVFPSQPGIPEEWQDEEKFFKMPSDITTVQSKDLGRLMTVINAILQWYGAVLASCRIDRLTSERVKNFAESRVRMVIFEDNALEKRFKAREDKEAYVNTHPVVIDAQHWFDMQDALAIMTEQLYKDMERSYALVSREITRRGGENQYEAREENLK